MASQVSLISYNSDTDATTFYFHVEGGQELHLFGHWVSMQLCRSEVQCGFYWVDIKVSAGLDISGGSSAEPISLPFPASRGSPHLPVMSNAMSTGVRVTKLCVGISAQLLTSCIILEGQVITQSSMYLPI